MKILFLGAGASYRAGYPLASELLPSIEKESVQNLEVLWHAAWQKWQSYRDAATGPLRLVLRHPNPEVVLSQLDLFAEASRSLGTGHFKKKSQTDALSQVHAEGNLPSRYFKSSGHRDIWTAHEVQLRLVDCLEDFFRAKHFEDSLPENRSKRDYLRSLLSGLEDEDRVITLNWDTTVERTLAEAGRWNPLDGYGFPKDSRTGSSKNQLKSLPDGCENEKSAIKVFKLHGSVGWHLSGGQIYFSNPYFMEHFDFHFKEEPLPLFDPQAPEFGPDLDRVLAYPSFLKRLQGVEMQRVWQLAQTAVGETTSVEIIGYSLPESDLAIRAILGPLRFRFDRKELKITVVDPSGEVFDRWRNFLGKSIERGEPI